MSEWLTPADVARDLQVSVRTVPVFGGLTATGAASSAAVRARSTRTHRSAV